MSADFFDQFTSISNSALKPFLQAGGIAQECYKSTVAQCSGVAFEQMNTNIKHAETLPQCKQFEDVMALNTQTSKQSLENMANFSKNILNDCVNAVNKFSELFTETTAVAKKANK